MSWTDEHPKKIIIVFSWNFGIVSATKIFFLCFQWLTKPTAFMPAVMTKPLLTQNVIGLILVLWIVFIAEFFSWFHVKRFKSIEVRKFSLRLRVIGRSVGIVISHAVDAVKHKTLWSLIFHSNAWKFQTLFWRKCYRVIWKFLNKKCQNGIIFY